MENRGHDEPTGPDYIGPVLLAAPTTWVMVTTTTGFDIRTVAGVLLACWCGEEG